MAYVQLSNVVKNRLIREIRAALNDHSRFNKFVVSNKYSDRERAKDTVVVKNASADPIIFQADHFLGYSYSHIFLAKVEGSPGRFIEWVREDSKAVLKGSLSPQGYYYLIVNEAVSSPEETYAMVSVDPLLRIDHEVLVIYADGYKKTYQLLHFPVQEGSLEIFDATRVPKIKLLEGIHYTVDLETGVVTFNSTIKKGARIEADYRYPIASFPAQKILPLTSNNTLIPGVTLAFSEYFDKGDSRVVAITEQRDFAAMIFGGRWELSFSLGIIAMDPIESAKATDYLAHTLWFKTRDLLATEGMLIENVALTGESEDLEYEDAKEFKFESEISVTISADWEEHMPLIRYLKSISLYDPPSSPNLTEEEILKLRDTSSLKAVVDLPVIPAGYICERIK